MRYNLPQLFIWVTLCGVLFMVGRFVGFAVFSEALICSIALGVFTFFLLDPRFSLGFGDHNQDTNSRSILNASRPQRLQRFAFAIRVAVIATIGISFLSFVSQLN